MPVQTIIESVSRTIRRKSAVVLVNKGFTVSAVAELVGFGVSTVSRSLERIVNTGDIIDLPRSGRPAIYSETFKLELIGFYCQTQPFPNSGRWTLRWAAVHLAAHPKIINAIPKRGQKGSSLLLTLARPTGHFVHTFFKVPIRQHLLFYSFYDAAY